MPDPNSVEEDTEADDPLPILAVLPEIPRPPKNDTHMQIVAEPEADCDRKIEGKIAETLGEKIEIKLDADVEEKLDSKPLSDLALELVLNEIALQARLTTTATGAVIALAYSGELISRGTTGATATDVAICLRTKTGIATTCFESGEARRVDDLGEDANADSVAYRRSGVRSILVVPVQGDQGPAIGILEIFSPRPNAFCERDLVTLQALARRVATNVELVQQSEVHAEPTSGGRLRPGASSSTADYSVAGSGKVWPTRPKFKAPGFVTKILAQRSKLKSVDWISVQVNAAVVLVLAAGCMTARSCWQSSGDKTLIQLIREPVLNPAKGTERHTGVVAPSTPLIAITNAPISNASTELTPAFRPLQIVPSITVQRQPIHKPKPAEPASEKALASAGPGPDVVSSDIHKTALKDRVPAGNQYPSNDPAASVLPNKIGQGVTGPEVMPASAAMARLVQRIEPEYPNSARQQHIQGTVLLDVVVDTSGAVETLSLVSGESQLMAAAEQAVRQWKFQPLMKDGQATKFETRIAIDFKLVFEGASGNH